jgi:hypothetical protein
MTPDAIRFQIVSQATEDFTGLWELAAATRAPDPDKLIGVLSGLIQERLINVYRETVFASEETALAIPAARKEIRDKSFWDWSAPEHGTHLRVAATPKGRDRYLAHQKPSADAGTVSR